MIQLNKILKKSWFKKLLIALILLGSIVWAGKGIFKYSVFSTHDLDHHLARSFDAVQTFKEGHFPMRWAGSLNYFCGIPIYNFFYPLIYYLVILINSLNFDIITALKIINFLSLLVGTLFFYLWMKAETKKDIPALGGALLYLYAPYRFSLIFVRGSPEFLAYAILPVVLYLYVLFFDSTGRKMIFFAFLASLTGALLAISHNFTVMFLFPLIFAYLLVKSILLKINLNKIYWLVFSFISSFGLAAFFIGPALLEKKYTRIGENFLFWKEHFPTLGQLIKSPWGYFYSSLGTQNDGMSFMLGYAHWVVLGIAAIWIIYRLIVKRKLDIWIIFTFLASVLTIYLILPWSIPVWEALKPLQEIQFSWRLLGVAIFTISALFSFILDKINSKFILIPIFVGVVLLGFYGNRNHLLPQPISVQDLYKYDDFEKLHFHRYSTTTLGDDIIAKGAKEACWIDVPLIATEKEEIKFDVVERGNTYGFVKFNFPKSPKGKQITTGLGYFPGIYKFELNGKAISYDDCNGRVCFGTEDVRMGQNYISWKIGQSKIENIFNYVTLTVFAVWVIVLFIYLTGIYENKKHKNKKNFVYLISAIVIFSLFLFFRSYNLPGRVGFGWDQERDAWTTTGILSGKLTLLGPRVQGPAGFFLPPYFFYLLAPFYALGNLSSYTTIGFIVFWSTLFFIVSYVIISRVFDKKTALFFLILWAVNPLAVSIDTIAWNPVVVPLLFILLIYLIHLYFKNPRTKYIFLNGIIFGLGISFHLQFLFIFPIFIPLIYGVLKGKKFRELVFFGAGSFIPFLPILLFDFRHNFLNFRQIVEFVKSGNIEVNRVLLVWDRASSFMVGGSPSKILGIAIYLLVLIGLFVLGKKLKDKVQKKIFLSLGFVWAGSLPLFYIFIKNPSEYYFNYLLVPLIIFLSYIIKSWKRLGILILIGIVVYSSFKANPLLGNVALSLREKDEAVSVLRKITKARSPFDVSFDVPFNEDSGFRYLLNFHKVEASGKSTDPLIEFVIPHQKKPTAFVLGQIGIYIPDNWLDNNWPKLSK